MGTFAFNCHERKREKTLESISQEVLGTRPGRARCCFIDVALAKMTPMAPLKFKGTGMCGPAQKDSHTMGWVPEVLEPAWNVPYPWPSLNFPALILVGQTSSPNLTGFGMVDMYFKLPEWNKVGYC